MRFGTDDAQAVFFALGVQEDAFLFCHGVVGEAVPGCYEEVGEGRFGCVGELCVGVRRITNWKMKRGGKERPTKAPNIKKSSRASFRQPNCRILLKYRRITTM